MNLKKSQSYIELTVMNWDKTDFGSTLREMCEAAKEYENDNIKVHQVVDLGKRKGESHYLIILNISQNLDNLGAPVGN
ncbi:hypothetical protein [Priestia megaterium]|jgi:hypothetical protein|uniref:hypothetical protein n=1 Tax=Priestia megaterium TaxID=1404 RepID=UPI00064C88FF|nr:hypothetical protein [Priestia megaterium]KLV28831.1 hypothetical protein ABW04_27650 [Priestia megaterium]MCE4093333.1 hypothetical protein [Priestia megaterium]MDN4634677.1 hypothetical protein [Sphingomonas sp. PsM26]HES8073994.1 hypothetical protein [Streptococcus pyogenes]